ncbi:dynein axonemal intermediate chain 7-like isoform X2 [Leptopilina heterotoma]|uniref:dynein axonemal intermediate chain 7-like isoform X2 n=1 Tax=Leptopilina heterotoma TaxID=63436 RepID=UPI001CAA0815|nr:dynein axonemal intermediate chain 7-like isoform X2 [Leptopilina heterotoma]XP_043481153.1 dynein axonemal intermediate chain 7-like isoform X2 [Leptopilina heterotoma]
MTKKKKKAAAKEEEGSPAAEAERLKNQMIKDMIEEIRLEKLNSENQVELEEKQNTIRRIQLEETLLLIAQNKKSFDDYVLEEKDIENWQQYMTCDGLPDPGILSELNTFLYLWSLDDENASMETISKHCEIIIYLLSKLEDKIKFSTEKPEIYVADCKTIRQELRNKLQFWIDAATYKLLRHIEQDMLRVDLRNTRFIQKSIHLVCCIWALIRLPISIKQIAEKDRKSIEVNFDEINLTVKMPPDIDCYSMAIRGLWLNYDHYSDLGISYTIPNIPEKCQMNMDLLAYCECEFNTKNEIREEQKDGRQLRLEEKKLLLEKLTNPPPPPQIVKSEKKNKTGKKTDFQKSHKKQEPEPDPEPLPYLPTPDEIIIQSEVDNRKELRQALFTRCEKTQINLRKYLILGGIYHIDLIYQPPQPKDMRRDMFLTTLQIPKKLRFVPFSKPYIAPPSAPESERTPEVIEAEMKALEAAMEALALVTLKLPDSVLWFEPPLVAHWIPEKRIWSTNDVHDIKYNEEKQIITFRSGRLGIHGLAAFRYVNIPFQSWEMKPESGRSTGGGVILSITAAIIQAEFIVREDLVCLHSLVGGTTNALQNIVNQYMKLHLLIKKMRDGGCDLFPEDDAYSYVKGLPIKHPVTEKHLQACMGLLCTAYTFAWSRWNVTRVPRQIVIQIKELHGCIAKQQTNMTLLVTPVQTVAVECTEVSPEFTDKPVEGDDAKFYSDLYHMALHNAGIKSRILMKNTSFILARTVTKLLQKTNVISMSS